MGLPSVSIIIPVNRINDFIVENVEHLKQLDYTDFEVLVFYTEDGGPVLENPPSFLRLIRTDLVKPGDKRDLALEHAKGEVFAFIDDDAYPQPDWLARAMKHFEDEEVGAVAGPNVTPEDDPLSWKASGVILESFLGSGSIAYRYRSVGSVKDVDDFPTVNLIVRRDVFDRIGGFDTHYWPGEDTKFCLDVVNMGKRIRYDPDVVVFHHRRPLFWDHFHQIGRYGRHRGYFMKAFPETSLRAIYFTPVLLLLYAIALPLLSKVSQLTLIPGAVYATLVLVESAKGAYNYREPSLFFYALAGFVLNHLWYGINILRGLSSRELYSKV